MASRLLASHGVSWDQNEQLVWSQQLALGYGPQPPLYTWLQWGLVGVLGPSTLAVVLLKNSLIALSFAFMLLAARQVLPARQAWLAAAGMTWLPGIAWQLLRDQTHTVMLTCAICATWWLLLRQLRQPRPLGFVYLGLVVAWGMLSKYSYLLVAVTLLLACLSMASTRRALLSRGWWLTPLISIALVAPHAWWVLEHWQAASGATLDKLHPAETSSYLSGLAHGLRDLLAFLLLAVLPLLLMARWTSGRFWQQPAAATGAVNHSPTPDWLVPLLGRYMALVAGALVLMALAGAAKFDGRWIQPLLLIFPLYMLARWPALAQSDTSRRRYLLACLGMLVLVWSLALLAPLRDAKRGKGDRLNWQLDLIANTLRQAGYQGQGMVLAEHHTTGGVMRSGCAVLPYSSRSPWTASRGQCRRGNQASTLQSANAGLSQVSVQASTTQRALLPWYLARRSNCAASWNSARASAMPARVRSSTKAWAAMVTSAVQAWPAPAAIAMPMPPPTLWPSNAKRSRPRCWRTMGK